jgi:hypothetical protein
METFRQDLRYGVHVVNVWIPAAWWIVSRQRLQRNAHGLQRRVLP